MRRACGVMLAAAAVFTDGHAAAPVPVPLLDRCPGGGQVDEVFRDAALRALQGLVISAPGQPADGAVQAHHSAGHIDPQGQAWYYVSAYQVNLAFIGALNVSPRLLPSARSWLRWQARHTMPTGPGQGVVFDHWVRAADLHESTCPPGMDAASCPRVDAFDSTAASLLLLADTYARRGADAALLQEPTLHGALTSAAGTLSALTQRHGLTWAKPDHQVAYLMDAVEVAAGWRAWARLQADVYGAPQEAQASLGAARRMDEAIVRHLWHAPSHSWRVSLGAGPADFSRWYPDTVAQAWPLLWSDGSDLAARARAHVAWRRAAGSWHGPQGWPQRNVDPAGFWWPAVAVAARCVGDDVAAGAWVARARTAWLRDDAPFAWPFQVGDLRWLFWLSDPVAGSGGRGFSVP